MLLGHTNTRFGFATMTAYEKYPPEDCTLMSARAVNSLCQNIHDIRNCILLSIHSAFLLSLC